MSSSPPSSSRALRRFAPAVALAVLTAGLLPLAGDEGQASLLMLLAAPLATQVLVSTFARGRPLVAATALPAVSLGALAIGGPVRDVGSSGARNRAARAALAADAALGGDADSDEPAFQAGVNRLEALQELMLRALAVWLIFAALWAVLPT